MRSNTQRAALAGLTALLAACSGGTPNGRMRQHDVGTLPYLHSSLQVWPDLNTVVTTNRLSHTIEQFTLAPAAHVSSLVLPRPENDQLALPSADAAYVVTASGYGYAVVKVADGSATLDPLAVPGNIMSVAFAPSQGFLALLDDQQNLILATISTAGDVTGTWQTTTQLPSKEWATSSAMLADGSLLLATSGSHIAVVDVAASVTAQAWKEKDVAVTGATDLKWVAGISGLTNDSALVLDANRLVVVDLKTGAILDQKSLGSAQILSTSRDLTPHVVSQTQSEVQGVTNDVTYVGTGGKLATITVQGTVSQITATLIDPQGGTIAIVYDPDLLQSSSYNPDYDFYARRQIYRFHLTDGSAVDTSNVSMWVNALVRPAAMLTLHSAALGEADVRTYGETPTVTTFDAYDYAVDARLDAP